jgi:hypothetical protein
MTGTKKYLQRRDMLMNAIHDLAELQKAKTLLCDTPSGTINLLITMYTVDREYRFTVKDDLSTRTEVSIEVIGEEQDKQRLIDHEFALLDYVLIDRAKIEFAEQEEFEAELQAGKESKKRMGTMK